ncbi:hypothetical protein PCCS19_33250 [Paenibacillus sp. CCS19]|nr:hypothetical protein PCCS19_33250 [Paenibacillus cellulosilyticus]
MSYDKGTGDNVKLAHIMGSQGELDETDNDRHVRPRRCGEDDAGRATAVPYE